ncbi:MAG: LysR family transcriptional regulator [Acidobacteria bacterium]|nr:LysR family transcriptional regulator [Acidobacteriota bacterium]
MDLNAVRMFAMVAAKGSFSSAARVMNVPVATVSRKVALLELELETRLFERSTRKLRLTSAGKALYEYAERGVEEFEAGLMALQEQQHEMTGLIRLSMPLGFSPMWTVLADFQKVFTNVDICVFSTERRVDFIEDGIDVALRVGDRQSRSSIARNLGAYRHKLVATPDFLARYSVQTPDDLKRVPCIAWGHQGREVLWQLGDRTIPITPKLRVNDYQQLSSMVLSGAWITELPPFLCSSLIKQNILVEVFPETPLPEQRLSLLYPSRKNLPRITRVFIDFISSHLLSALAAEGPNDR